jgi:xylulokinase
LPDDIVLGIDLGTSSMKAVAVTLAGEVLARARAEYPMHRPHSGWNENDPRDWMSGFEAVVAELAHEVRHLPGQIRALSVVGQRDPVVLLDEADEPVAPAISWTDQRTRRQLEEVEHRVGRQRLIEITGGRPVVGGGLVNALWAREHTPEAWSRTRRLASPKDYLLTAIGGDRATDATTPTRSLAFDVAGRTWSEEILGAVGVDPALFDPAAAEPWEPRGVLAPAVADHLGLPAGVTLATGCADDHAATIGSGAVAPGEWSLGTGTCSSWRRVGSAYEPDLEGRIDCSPHAIADLFIHEATIDSVGSTLRWFRAEVAGGASYDEILRMAAGVPAGAEGVRCLPFVDGAQRAPLFHDGASAAFLGISSRHTTAHLARAVIESIAYLYVPTYRLMGAADGDRVTIVDGEASSAFWNQVKADVLGRPIRTPAVLDAGAMGAAVLAAVAAGLHANVPTATRAMVRWRPLTEPDAARHREYAELADEFATLCNALLSVSGTLRSQRKRP